MEEGGSEDMGMPVGVNILYLLNMSLLGVGEIRWK